MSVTLTGPEVYLVGRQVLNQPELDRFLADTGHTGWTTDAPSYAQALVELGGRDCYQSYGKGRAHAAHVRHLVEVSHGSCLEHAVWTFKVTGVSRSLTHELVRHKHLKPSQLSQRYVDHGGVDGNPLRVVPPPVVQQCLEASAKRQLTEEDRLDAEIASVFTRHMQASARAYAEMQALLKRKFAIRPAAAGVSDPKADPTALAKAAKGAARCVLPEATETRIQITADARALRNLIEQRCSPAADAEFRRLAYSLLCVMRKEAPDLFFDFEDLPQPDGTTAAVARHKKV